jgi:hypothetical protein
MQGMIASNIKEASLSSSKLPGLTIMKIVAYTVDRISSIE